MIHEIGHNWDTELEDLGVFTEFKRLSGWTQTKPSTGSYSTSTDGKWYYLTSAKFISDHAKTNPREDWAETFEEYFRWGYTSSSPIAAKLKIVDGLVQWAKAGMPLI